MAGGPGWKGQAVFEWGFGAGDKEIVHRVNEG